MKWSFDQRNPITVDSHRLISVFLVTALLLAHPVPARNLHYCSSTGELVEMGRGCRSSAGACCAGEPAVSSPSCCSGSAEKEEGPGCGPFFASPPCSSCCRQYTLAGIEPLVAASALSMADIEIALRDLSVGPVEYRAFPLRATSSWRGGPAELPPTLPIYLLACRFLI